MEFVLSEEHEQLRDGVRAFLQEKSPPTEVRRLMDGPDAYDEAVWKQMAEELQLQALHIPEEYGGQGFSFAELGIVLEEMGRVLLVAPYFASVCLAANAIMNAGTEAQRVKFLPELASGALIGTLAVTEPHDRAGHQATVTMPATSSGGDWMLNGTKTFVIDGHRADIIVVAARVSDDDGGVRLFVVDGDAEGLTRTPLATMDLTRNQARLDFHDVAATPLGDSGRSERALARTLDQAVVCLANEMVGGAQRVLEMAVEYAKIRVQFGRPIGSFQAIKHKCADMLVGAECMKSVAMHAAWVAAHEPDQLAINASLAKAYVSDGYFRVATDNIQIHGGIGFTWEHDAHLYFKRAKSSALLFGDSTYHRRLLAAELNLARGDAQ